ncbi:MAG: hypothetical protein WC810_14365 [Janthinobacterium sp.]|jgi:hypothetical protein
MKDEDEFINGLEDDKARYNKTEEEKEKLDFIGQPNEKKGANAVSELMREGEKKQADKMNRELEILDSIRLQNKLYREQILFFLHDKLKEISWPVDWQWGVWFDGTGAVVAIQSPDKKKHSRAFKISYMTKYDYNAVEVFVRWAEDVIDLLKTQNSTDQLDIWTPEKSLN